MFIQLGRHVFKAVVQLQEISIPTPRKVVGNSEEKAFKCQSF